MKCADCGANLKRGQDACEYCGNLHPHAFRAQPERQLPPVVVNIHQGMTPQEAQQWADAQYQKGAVRSDKSRWMAFFFCVFFGYLGVHKFYLGKIGTGIVYLLTFGVFGMGWAVDTLLLLFGLANDRYGRRLS